MLFETTTPGRVEASELDPGEEDEDEVDGENETNDEQEDIEGDDEEELDEEDGELDEDDDEEELNVGRYKKKCRGQGSLFAGKAHTFSYKQTPLIRPPEPALFIFPLFILHILIEVSTF